MQNFFFDLRPHFLDQRWFFLGLFNLFVLLNLLHLSLSYISILLFTTGDSQ